MEEKKEEKKEETKEETKANGLWDKHRNYDRDIRERNDLSDEEDSDTSSDITSDYSSSEDGYYYESHPNMFVPETPSPKEQADYNAYKAKKEA